MAVYTTSSEIDATFFVTFTVKNWIPLFTNEQRCQLFAKWFDYQIKEYGNQIKGYVIMPNHFHGLIYLSKDSPQLSTLIMNAKRFMAYELVKSLKENKEDDLLQVFEHIDPKRKQKHELFEPRFDSKIVKNEKFFFQKLNYIHQNPVKEPLSLSNRPEQYKYSRASNYHQMKSWYPNIFLAS